MNTLFGILFILVFGSLLAYALNTDDLSSGPESESNEIQKNDSLENHHINIKERPAKSILVHRFFSWILAILVFLITFAVQYAIVHSLMDGMGARRVRGPFLMLPIGLASFSFYLYPKIADRILNFMSSIRKKAGEFFSKESSKLRKTSESSFIRDIKELKEMLDSGMITEEEFKLAKDKLLKS